MPADGRSPPGTGASRRSLSALLLPLQKLRRLHDSFALPADPAHPVQIALRTYALTISLSLGPAVLPFVLAASTRVGKRRLWKVLKAYLAPTGFPFAVTLAVSGGAALERVIRTQQEHIATGALSSNADGHGEWKKRLLSLSPELRTFLANLVTSFAGVFLLHFEHRKRVIRHQRDLLKGIPDDVPIPFTVPSSPTFDLTLLLLVRAIDSGIQSAVFHRSNQIETQDDDKFSDSSNKSWEKTQKEKCRKRLTARIDALVFWACSSCIMWSYFYEPHRLPNSYVKWITRLAKADHRLLLAIQKIRDGGISYSKGRCTPPNLLQSYAQDLGYPASWGDFGLLPAHGGQTADNAWRALGVKSRDGIGGLPCELVHGGVGRSIGLGDSCTSNVIARAAYGFAQASLLYLPAHFIPILITRPRLLLRPDRVLQTLLNAGRSATFLSTFISSIWFTVCLVRTIALARLFPNVSHDVWDQVCVIAGTAVCGSSIWIESARRRGEMSLYVLPRAIRACLPNRWLKRSGRSAMLLERIVFAASLSYLLTAANHRTESLRGLSRWTLAFVINGPDAGFWKRKRASSS